MSSMPKKPPLAAEHVARGSRQQPQARRAGTAVHRPGTHSPAEHAAAQNGDPSVRRQAHMPPTSVPRKGDGDAGIL